MSDNTRAYLYAIDYSYFFPLRANPPSLSSTSPFVNIYTMSGKTETDTVDNAILISV